MEIIKQELADRKAFLEELAEQLESSLACAPPGKLRINRRDGKPQYYLKLKKGERDGKYIRKSEIAKAAAIAQRDYEKDALKTTLAEIAGIDTLLGIWENRTVEGTFDKLALPRKVLVIPATVSDEEYARKWQEVQYKRKGFSPEDPELFSTSGDRVRSKSEGLLKDNFDYFKVPCRIECPLKLLTGEIIHPDFTLLNVKTRKEYLWEHLGKADDPVYMNYNIERINNMILSGYVPGENLILTFETREKPLNQRVVKELIRRFLL